jgi:radical SAM-linked protein
MLESASAGAARRSAGGILWPVQVRFAKQGPARFLSHLETGKIIDRAFRMAGIPVGHTAGHSPHPKYHFGPPLPVGVESEVELFDVDLEIPWRRDHVDALNDVLPRGFAVLHGRTLPASGGRRRKSLSAEARLAGYEAVLARLERRRLETIPADLSSFAKAEDWILRKRHRTSDDEESGHGTVRRRLSEPPDDPRIKTVDMKRACIELSWEAGAARLTMLLRILDENGQTANPAHVLGGILGLSAEEQALCRIARTSILRSDRSPMAELTPR